MLIKNLAELGYDYTPGPTTVLDFANAVRTGNLIYTSGQVCAVDGKGTQGKVGDDVSLVEAYNAAELADINDIQRIVKVLGMVNVGGDFNNTSGVINGATHFLNKLFPDSHARDSR